MMICESSSMFLRSINLMVPFGLTFHLVPCKITFLTISQLLMGKMLPEFNTR